MKGEHNLKALTLQLFAQRQDGTLHLGPAVDRNTVLTPRCCLKTPQAGTTKKKTFPGKLMQNVHRKILKCLKVRRVLKNWNPVFQLSLHVQLSYIYMY